MIGPDLLSRVTAEAVIPEQLLPYARAVSKAEPCLIADCLSFLFEDKLLLIAYPVKNPGDSDAMAHAVDEALKILALRRLTVIGPSLPPQAPLESLARKDSYYSLPVPPPPPAQKLRNLLRRAGRELIIERGRQCEADHLALVRRYLDERRLATGTRRIFEQLPHYIETAAGSLVLSGRLPDGRLAAFAVGDFSALRTAFFMFCFRDAGLAPPGSADFLLAGLLEEAHARGQTLMNLGLGINEGVAFFKRKWGAVPFLPYVEVSWTLGGNRRLKRLLSFFKR